MSDSLGQVNPLPDGTSADANAPASDGAGTPFAADATAADPADGGNSEDLGSGSAPGRAHHPFAYATASTLAESDPTPPPAPTDGVAVAFEIAGLATPETLSGATLLAPPEATPAPLGAPSTGSAAIVPDIVFQTDPVSDEADIIVEGQSATNSYGVTGAGISIGIISDSFNANGGAAAAEADGALPAAADVHILQDATSGTDEGQAMAEIVHSIAPNAQIYFYDAGDSDADMAQAIEALQAAGCQIIVDDVAYLDEPYFEEGGTISQAVNQVVADGSTYFTAANNFAQSYYQGSFTPDVVGGKSYEDFNVAGVASPYLEPITIPRGATVIIDLQWAQPFLTADGAADGSGSNYSLAYRLISSTGGTVDIGDALDKGGDPVQYGEYTNTGSSTTFFLEIWENQTGTVSPGEFKIVVEDDSFTPVVFDDPNAATGSGTVFGHEEDPSAITVGAVPEDDPTTLEPYSGSGPGEFYYNSSGVALSSPVTAGKVNLLAPDGNTTTIFDPFYGTSAAAPAAAAVGALVLQANGALDPADIENILEDSASPTVSGSATETGAGLVDAYLAVGEAETLTFSETASTGTLLGTHLGATFVGGAGNHTITGEGGVSTLDYAAAPAAVSVNFSTGTATNGDGGTDTFSGIEVVDGTPFNDTFVSGSAGETIYGGGGSDSLSFGNLAAGGTIALDGGNFGADQGTDSGSNAGTIDVGDGSSLEVYGTLANAGSLIANDADLDVTGTLSGAGSALVEDGGILTLGGSATGVAFGSGISTLKLANPLSFAGDAISDIMLGDIIDLAGAAVASATIVGSMLSIVESGGTNFAYAISGALAGDHFGTTSDGSTGTDLILENGSGVTYALAQATLNTPTTLNLGDTRIGGTLSQALSITNSATPPAEGLDVSLGPTTVDATAAGAISLLAAGATNASSIVVGLGTAAAGAQSGTVTLDYFSDGTGTDGSGTTSLGTATLTLGGAVYREATGSVATPAPLVVHVGDTVSVPLVVTNTAAADGYSEDLIASVGPTSGVTASGTTGDIAAQGSSSAIVATVSTSSAGTVAGSVTLDFESDGTGIDGFGPTADGTATVAIDATVDNYAVAALEETSGGGTWSQSGTSYTLSLGSIAEGAAPITVGLGALNDVTGPADLLSGSFTASGSSAFTNSGLGAFSGLAAMAADTAPSVTLSTSTAGTFSETITLAATGSNSSGYSGALAAETLTITGTIAASAGATWVGPSASARSGSFNAAANWSPAIVPASATAVSISNSGTYTVTSGQSNTVASLALSDSAATLAINAGTFAILGTSSNSGCISVGDAASLQLTGTMTNSIGSAIVLDSTGDATALVIAGSAMLKGAGTITMSDSAGNAIISNGAAATLTNTSTIAGSGTIGDAYLSIVNSTGHVIDATGTANALTVTGAGIKNSSALIEATGSAGLVIANTTVTAGTISAAGGNVEMLDATLLGGTLTSSAGNVIATEGTTDMVSGTTTAGTVSVSDGTELTLKGTTTDNGTIALASTGDATDLVIAATVSLKGAGTLTMSDNENNAIISNGVAEPLNNYVTIAGAGTIGDSFLTLVNEAGGTIDASDGDGLTIATGTHTVTNDGLIEATGAGGLTIENLLTNNGTLAASGGDVTVSNQVSGTGVDTIANGTLTFANKVASTQAVSFAADTTGTLALGLAQSFAGTVAGLTGGDAIDLTDFAFSGAPSIGSVSAVSLTGGSGVAVTVKDGSLSATIDLLNQSSITYSTSASAYELASDGTGAHSGTLLELAPPAA